MAGLPSGEFRVPLVGVMPDGEKRDMGEVFMAYLPAADLKELREAALRPEQVITIKPDPKHLTTEDFEALPEHTVVLDRDEDAWQKRGGTWCSYDSAPVTSEWLTRYGPFFLLGEV